MKHATIISGWLLGSVACLFGQAGCSGSNQNSKDLISMPKNPEADAAHVKGADVLRESEKAYAALSSYKGTITIADTAQYANFAYKSSRQFKVFFQRPGRIRLEGRDSNGNPVLIISDGKNAVDLSDINRRTGRGEDLGSLYRGIAGSDGNSTGNPLGNQIFSRDVTSSTRQVTGGFCIEGEV